MECREARAYLTEYIDGFLLEKERAQLEAHLQACAACKKEVEALRALRGELRALKIEDTSDFVFDIEKAKTPAVLPLYRQRWVRALSVTAACFVLFIGVLAVTQNGYQTPQNSEVQILGSEAADEEDAMTARETNGESEMTNGPRARTAEVPYAETELAVPDTYTYYSSQTPEAVQEYAGKENQKSASVTAEDASTAEPGAGAGAQVESEATVPTAPMMDKTDDAFAPSSQAPASGGASANPASGGSASGIIPAPTYTKRTVTLSVSPEAQERFSYILSGMPVTRANGEILIGASDLNWLLRVDGVQIVSDQTVECNSETYLNKVVLIY